MPGSGVCFEDIDGIPQVVPCSDSRGRVPKDGDDDGPHGKGSNPVDPEKQKREKALKDCVNQKTQQANQARENYIAQLREEVMPNLAVLGWVGGAYEGVLHIAPHLGIAGYSGTLLGGAIGAMVGGATDVLTEIAIFYVKLGWYDYNTYGPTIERAPIDCSLEVLGNAH